MKLQKIILLLVIAQCWVAYTGESLAAISEGPSTCISSKINIKNNTPIGTKVTVYGVASCSSQSQDIKSRETKHFDMATCGIRSIAVELQNKFPSILGIKNFPVPQETKCGESNWVISGHATGGRVGVTGNPPIIQLTIEQTH